MNLFKLCQTTLVLAIAGNVSGLAHAQGFKTPSGDKYALLVGVRDYNPNELKSLQYTERDVTELGKVLLKNGYRKENVMLLTQTRSGEKIRYAPTAANIRDELQLVMKRCKANDTVLIAFAGHGVQFKDNNESYFCPADTKVEDRKTLIALTEVYNQLDKCPARTKLLLVDACRNDPLVGTRSSENLKISSVTRPRSKPQAGGVVAMFSCSPGELAYNDDDSKHGLFFHFVIQGLKGAAAKKGSKEVSLNDLESYVTEQVSTKAYTKFKAIQQPEVIKKQVGNLILASLDSPALGGEVTATENTVAEDKLSKNLTNKTGMKLVLLPTGEFLMGSTKSDTDAQDDEKPQHAVRITTPIYMGEHEVTVGHFRKFVEDSGYQTEAEKTGKGFGFNPDLAAKGQNPWEQNAEYTWKNPGFAQTEDHPVVMLSWTDCLTYCKWLSQKEKRFYRLPTEAEWEYGCRAKTTTKFTTGERESSVELAGNFADASLKTRFPQAGWTQSWKDGSSFTAPVGNFEKNAFGLYDMHGNAWEWCNDFYDADYYQTSPTNDPRGPSKGDKRVMRGGCWSVPPSMGRAADRAASVSTLCNANNGFRVVMVPHVKVP